MAGGERSYMRISVLMICPQFNPIVGGYERAAERLAVALSRHGTEVTVVTERRESDWPRRDNFDMVPVHRLPCIYRRHLHIVSALSALAWYLLWHGRRFDVWHVHQYGLHAALAVAMGKILGRPVALKLTSSARQGIGNAISETRMSRAAAAMLRRVDACVAVSRETAAEALDFGIQADRIHAIGNGVDVRAYYPPTPKDRLVQRAYFDVVANGLVVFVGRLSREKNPDGLLAAWRIALPRLPRDWKLVLVGDGPMRDMLEKQIAVDGLRERVIVAGGSNDVDRWLRAADVFVMPSHNEGLSNTMLEAMASGLPIVSTNVSGSLENLREPGAGVVVDVGCMEQFAEALVNLAMDESLRQRMGERGRNVIESKYSIDQIAAAHLELYERLIAIE